MEIGGECGHHWCVEQRAEAASVVVEERPVVVVINRKALVKEASMSVDPAHVTLTVTARDIRAGDVFTLHGHERTATHSTWPTALRNHVHISFVGGGDAVIPADRKVVVTRAKELGCVTA
jgi:glutaredoxin-related protein